MKLTFLIAMMITGFSVKGQEYSLSSPNGELTLQVAAGKGIVWSASLHGHPVIRPSPIMLVADSVILGSHPVVKSAGSRIVREHIIPVVARKSKVIENYYNELTVLFKGHYGIRFRAY